jgi:O-antigen/teichoic acid export membrane protein
MCNSTVDRPNTPQPHKGGLRTGEGLATAACAHVAPLPPGLRHIGWARRVAFATSRPQFRKLTTSGSLALADQFLFALSQLILTVGLARSLSPSDYGAFTVAYTTFLLFGTAHTALLTEPLMVFGSSKYANSFKSYLTLLVKGHMAVTGLVAVLMALFSALLARFAPSLATALFYVGVTGPLILLPWLLRRACYARLLAHSAVVGGALYCGSMSIGLLWLTHGGLLSLTSAFVLMAAASLVASVFMVSGLRSPRPGVLTTPIVKEVAADHWRYGRWALGAGMLTWLQTSIYYFLLPHFASVATTGALKAVMNLVLPLLHGYTALSMVLLPTLAQAGSPAVLRSRLRLALPLFLLPALVYCSITALYHQQIFEWLYAGQYSGVSWLLPLAAPMVIAAGVGTVYSTALRAVQRPDRVFWAYAFASGATLTAGVAATARYQLPGAILGLTLSYVIVAGTARRQFNGAVAAANAAGGE